MTVALLDHPWPLDAGLDAGSEAVGVLLAFVELTRRHVLTPARFVPTHEYTELLQRLKDRKGSVSAAIRRFADHLVRHEHLDAFATPDTEPPPPLSDDWKRALRAAMDDLDNWRNPQIIFPQVRGTVWPKTPEVGIYCSDRADAPPEIRLLICLQDYESHPFAICDQDPWRHLERRLAPQGGRIIHPCTLPRHPDLHGVALPSLQEFLEAACRRGWRIGERYYFLPAADYEPLHVDKAAWRNGRAFNVVRAEGRERSGPVDHAGRVWEWDLPERHWDVQIPGDGYITVSHDGRLLKYTP
jgi:hypothetical protein